MPEPKKCSQCGACLPAEGWEGLCPKCLVRVSLETPSQAGEPASSVSGADVRRFGDYELLEEIARGGMGVVYKARQVSLNRTVAVKMILAGQLASKSDVQRFHAEAESAARLQHPNIVAIHEIGQQDGQHFFSMDYVEGQNLAEFVGQKPLPPKQAANYVKTIAQAIDYAHSQGILHRDLKPSNILIDHSDQPLVTDFGLAKQMKGDSDVTLSGQVLGSPSFMPPEQAGGKRGQLGPDSDIYALGAILYYLLTARPPFLAETVTETLQQVLKTDPLSPRLLNPGVPLDLATICLKCLEKEPRQRYGAAKEVAEELARFLRYEPILARPASRLEKSWRWCRRNPVVASFAGATAVLLLAVSIGSPIAALRINRERRAAQSNAAESRSRLVRQYVANGNRLVEEGDLLGALPWFANALKEERDPARAEVHRLRLGITLQQCPKLVHVWFHKDGVRDAKFSPDGHSVVTASGDGTAQVWDATSGETASPPCKGDGAFLSVAFSPDSQRVAAANQTGNGGVWNTQTGWLLFHFAVSGRLVEFSPDGNLLVMASGYGAQLWNAVTGAKVGQLMKNETPTVWASFSPNGSNVVTATAKVAIWRVPTGDEVSRLAMAENRGANYGEFSPDSRRVAISCNDGTAWVFEADSAKMITIIRHQGIVNRACFSPDGRWLLTASDDGTAAVWNANTGVPVSATIKHAGPIKDASFSPDGRLILTASSDGTAGVWYAANGRPATAKLKHARAIVHAAFSPDSRHVVTASEDHTARLWDLHGAGQAAWIAKHPAVALRASFSPDSRRAVTISVDGSAQVRDLITGQLLTNLQPNLIAVRHAAFSPDSRLIATASSNGTARVWDLATGQPVSPPLVHNGLVNYVDFSPDGKRVVTAGTDRFARVWEVASGRLPSEMRHPESVNYAWFSPDGKQVLTVIVSVPDFYPVERWAFRLAEREEISLSDAIDFHPEPKWAFGLTEREAITSNWSQAQIWDAATGQPITPPRKLGASVSQVAVSPDRRNVIPTCSSLSLTETQVWPTDLWSGQRRARPLQHDRGIIHASYNSNGKWAVTASWDGCARIWDVMAGQPLGPQLLHGKAVYFASFSADDRLVVTASEDQSARLWDAMTGEPVTPPLQHRAAVYRALLSPDGRWLLTTSVDGTVRGWRLPMATGTVEDELTQAEFLAGHYIDNTGSVLPIGPELAQSAWLKWQVAYEKDKRLAALAARPSSQAGTTAETTDEYKEPRADTHPIVSPAQDYIVRANKMQRGSLPFTSNSWAEIVEDLSRVIEIEPDVGYNSMYLWRSRGYEQLGDYRKAITDCRESLWRGLSKDGVGRDYLTQGQCYMRLGETEKAEADFQKALEYYSDNTAASQMYNNLAWFYATGPTNVRSPQKALPLAMKAVELGKTNYTELNTLGVVYYRLGKFTNTIMTLEMAIKTDKEGGSAYDFFVLAMSYQRLGNAVKAGEYFAKAMKWWAAQPNPPEGDAELLAFRAEAEEVLGRRTENERTKNVQ